MADKFESLARREWLLTNGIGGFASGTVAGCATRRYHALLVAALAPGMRRMTMLSGLDASLTIGEDEIAFATHVYGDGTRYPDGWSRVERFDDGPAAEWTFRLPDGGTLTQWIYLQPGANTVYVRFRCERFATLRLAPLVCWKDYHQEMRPYPGFPHASIPDGPLFLFQAAPEAPILRFYLESGGKRRAAHWESAGWWNLGIRHDREFERGFDGSEDLYCPATVSVALSPGKPEATFVATIEERTPTVEAAWQRRFQPAASREETDPADATLLQAADRFLVHTDGRTTILAGYPWFTDWGRDTFIALPGLCLSAGRAEIARRILLSFSQFVDAGMIPNRFPDRGAPPDYNTLDGTLWFVHACERYAAATGDTSFLWKIRPTIVQIIEAHLAGTRFGIRVDPEDGLLRGGAPGTNLTWMDAKIGDWVVTPRVGKPVEIQGLWIHALRFAAAVAPARKAEQFGAQADRAGASLRERFVRPDGLGLYDVLDDAGVPDAAIRPNQVLAAALPSCPLPPAALRSVLEVATQRLRTPYGLRTLDPADPAYRGRYEGDGPARDSAYHQGTVWPWLIGAYVDVHRKVVGDERAIAPLLAPLLAHLDEFGLGGIAEVFDGDAPHRPNGCPWQAWSVAELLRARRGG